MGKKKMKRQIAALEGILDSFEEELFEQREALQQMAWMMASRQVIATGTAPLQIEVPIVQLDPDLRLPEYAEEGDAGMDLRTRWTFSLEPGERMVVPASIALAIPQGFVGLIHPRSGLAAKRGVTVLNAPGTIDAGYRGEIKVPLYNAGSETEFFDYGDRIAQLVIQQVTTAKLRVVEELPGSERGEAGFGSTGTN
jgi:dUTP pyrophosphatase